MDDDFVYAIEVMWDGKRFNLTLMRPVLYISG